MTTVVEPLFGNRDGWSPHTADFLYSNLEELIQKPESHAVPVCLPNGVFMPLEKDPNALGRCGRIDENS